MLYLKQCAFNTVLLWLPGKHVGIVTNTRITHATPAAAYARSADRNWEGDSRMEGVEGGCKDIARQLIEDNPDIKAVSYTHLTLPTRSTV